MVARDGALESAVVATRVLLAAIVAVGITHLGEAQTARTAQIPYSDAKPILERLRATLPDDLAAIPESRRETAWASWASQLDRRIRARLERGDEDSAINLLLFGTSFTTLPRALNDSAKVGGREQAAEIVRGRIADLTAAIASPTSNERLLFVRELVRRHGIDPGTAAGREQTRAYFRTLMTRIVGEVYEYAKTIEAARGAAELAARSTLFHARGLSSDTSIRPDFAVDQAFEALRSRGVLDAGSVRRIGIVGPGLDFTDKSEGHDFYPQQTTQPFSVIESALRHGLTRPGDLRVATLDLNPRVNSHLERTRERARVGTGPVLVLPHDRSDRWSPGLTTFWQSLGRLIGDATTAPSPRREVEVRAVRVRPDLVSTIEPHDLNIVVERLVTGEDGDRFDLVVATNVLVYYSVFEQSLALANLASMLRPGGVLLSNNVLVELPTTPLRAVGHSTTSYSDRPDDRDDVIWYVRR
jgi:hypothetical protein